MQIFEKFKLIIFDLDGTITKPLHDFTKIKQTLELPLEQDILTSIRTMNGNERILIEQKLQEIEEKLAQKTELQHNVELVLRHLSKQNKHLAILTRNSKQNALISLRSTGLLNVFDPAAIYGRDESAPKPDPDGIKKLMNYFNVVQSESAIIGDYKYDLQAGKNAGISTIYYDPDEDAQWDEYADHKITDYFVT